VQRSSFDDPQPHTSRIFNYQMHKHPTQSVTFKVRANGTPRFDHGAQPNATVSRSPA
jgi:hypothetical protein